MSVTQETLMAYVDGALTLDEARQVEAEMAADGNVARYVEEQLALRRQLHGAFDEWLDAPLPERLLAAAAQPPSRRWRLRQAWASRATWRMLGIPAAALACGVVIGVLVFAPSGGDIISGPGGLVARGALSTALNDQLAGQRTASIQIGISFRDKSGRYCRTFADGGAAMAGVACHGDQAWHIAALSQTGAEEASNAAYRLSASTMPDAVRSAVRAMIAGAPLDAAGEQSARAHGWAGH